jgi:hypothetical protein
VASLFHYLDVQNPFNCYFLGKSPIAQCVASIPLISSNRCVRPAHAALLLNGTAI